MMTGLIRGIWSEATRPQPCGPAHRRQPHSFAMFLGENLAGYRTGRRLAPNGRNPSIN